MARGDVRTSHTRTIQVDGTNKITKSVLMDWLSEIPDDWTLTISAYSNQRDGSSFTITATGEAHDHPRT
jgi:hypothetical protein